MLDHVVGELDVCRMISQYKLLVSPPSCSALGDVLWLLLLPVENDRYSFLSRMLLVAHNASPFVRKHESSPVVPCVAEPQPPTEPLGTRLARAAVEEPILQTG